MKPSDLTAYSSLSDPQLHPDGSRVAFVVSRMDFDEDRYERSIWVFDGRSAAPFTHGPGDTRPRWSPDGSKLAFLRTSGEPKDRPQVAVMAAGGGEAMELTEFPLGATEAEWSPDGGSLAVVGLEWAPELADLDDDERKARPRRIDGPGYRFDDMGWVMDRQTGIYLVDPSGDSEPTRLTGPEFRDRGIAWRPDGAAVGFISARHDARYLDPGSQVWEVSVGGGEAEAITPEPGYWAEITYRPDGARHLVGHPDRWSYPRPVGVWRVEDDGLEELAAGLDRNFSITVPPVLPSGPQWLDDGRFRAVIEDRGTTRVVEVATDGSWVDVASGERSIAGMVTRRDGSAMALVVSTTTDPGELVWWEDGEETTATTINEGFRAGAGLVAPEHFTVESDGVDLDAWVYLPPGDGPVPLLLNVHGGPATQYGWGFFDEFQVYVSAGYGVVACNPRGSSGRGLEFVRAVIERWTEERSPDIDDVLAVVDAALERFDRLDADRMGIMGGSYGGLMTGWILPLDHRWKSAVPERGLYSFQSFSGTSDIGYRFPRMYLGDWEFSDWNRLWEASPLARAHEITTPCLVIHSEEDYRCPIEQAEQFFSVLLANGVEAEMLRFPGSSHELSRSGKPRLRKARFEAILDWHSRHLDVTT